MIGKYKGQQTGIPGGGMVGKVIGSNKGSTIGGNLGRAADSLVGGLKTSSSTTKPIRPRTTTGGTSTRPGDGKPYAGGPLW